MIKYTRLRNGSRLIGTIHNHPLSFEYINSIVQLEKFDFYLLELNKDNYRFLLKNKISISEFYPIISRVKKQQVKLIDVQEQKEIRYYCKNSKHFYDHYLNYRLNKFIFYKISNYFPDISNIDGSLFSKSFLGNVYQSHIKYREKCMIEEIQKYLSCKILIIVGLSHFDVIKNGLNIL
jgi:pheromone shutdown protein TraB